MLEGRHVISAWVKDEEVEICLMNHGERQTFNGGCVYLRIKLGAGSTVTYETYTKSEETIKI